MQSLLLYTRETYLGGEDAMSATSPLLLPKWILACTRDKVLLRSMSLAPDTTLATTLSVR